MCETTSSYDAIMTVIVAVFSIYGVLVAYGWARGDIGWLKQS